MTRNLCGGAGRATRRYRALRCGLVLAVVAAALILTPTSYAEGRCGTHPWCDTSLSPDERAMLLLGAMSQSDKIGVLTGKEASDVGMPPVKWTDGAVGAGGLGSGSNPATAMPAAMALAANFDQSMASTYGSVVGQEVRHRGFDGDFGPTVNIMRTPLGGRTFEAYGEDPFLSGQTAVGWIDGFQSQGVMADVKHFAANNQEGQIGVSPIFGLYGSRPFVNVHVDQRALHEIELTPFEMADIQAHSATTMCSYNLLEGQYACANPFLLKDTFRGLFGSDGFVVSDFLACHETEADLNAGMNFDIGPSCYNAPQVELALADGSVTQATFEARVYEILRKLFAVGFFDHPTWPNDISQDDRAADTAVADRTEEGGAVLLRNGGALPINPKKVHSIAVIGPAAKQYIFGDGSSQVSPYEKVTALEGISARAAQSKLIVTYNDGTSVGGAQEAARAASVAIVIAADSEGEGTDKHCMSLIPECSDAEATPANPEDSQLDFGNQDELISSVAAANPNTVVVLETGAPVLTPWRESINALLEAWYPGQDGGTAIAHVLFGDSDPGGRLPATFPKSEADLPTAPGGAAQYPGTVTPEYECELHAWVPCPYYQEFYKEGVLMGYRWYDNQRIEPAFPFGFGLSYTHFRFGELTVTPGSGPEPSATVNVTVTNTGARSGWAVPEVYLSLPSLSGVPQPPEQLKGFAKVALARGQSQRVSVPLNARSFSFWSDAANGWRVAPGCVKVRVGSSSRKLPLVGKIAVGGGVCR
ncbi:MAG: glycosyl hydrolase [Actinobacteria bacterium]|nr:MAG: glycosyl hydrolase [Actinomycetota bacterium]